MARQGLEPPAEREPRVGASVGAFAVTAGSSTITDSTAGPSAGAASPTSGPLARSAPPSAAPWTSAPVVGPGERRRHLQPRGRRRPSRPPKHHRHLQPRGRRRRWRPPKRHRHLQPRGRRRRWRPPKHHRHLQPRGRRRRRRPPNVSATGSPVDVGGGSGPRDVGIVGALADVGIVGGLADVSTGGLVGVDRLAGVGIAGGLDPAAQGAGTHAQQARHVGNPDVGLASVLRCIPAERAVVAAGPAGSATWRRWVARRQHAHGDHRPTPRDSAPHSVDQQDPPGG